MDFKSNRVERERLSKLKTKLGAYRRLADHWKHRFDKTRHSLQVARRRLTTPAVLETFFPERLAVARDRAQRPDAVNRHQSWMRTVERYARAVDAYNAGRMPNAQRIRLGALALWVPLDDRLPDRVTRARSQGLPLRIILSTREVALGRVMLDIGGNLGRTAIPRVVLGDVEMVYAAEPHPDNYDCLVWSILENGLTGLVLPDQVAISSHDGTASLVPSRFAGGHALRPLEDTGEGDVTLTVPCYRLDTWIERHGIDLQDVSFIKVDVQGWEPHVLRGALHVLGHRHIAWQVEIAPGRLARAGSRPDEFYALLESHFNWFVDLDKTRTGPRLVAIEDLRRSLCHLEVGSHETDLLLW